MGQPGQIREVRDKIGPTRTSDLRAIINLEQRLVPDLIDALTKRYTILRTVSLLQPVGRRLLAQELGITERRLRAEVDFLREQGLLTVSALGMALTPVGEKLVEELAEYVHEARDLTRRETALAERLRLERVIAVPGDSDTSETVQKDMGRAAAQYLKSILSEGMVLAVSGGTTLASVAAALVPANYHGRITVVPARGGMGEDLDKQAGSIAAKIAAKLNANHRLLHLPDNLGEEAAAVLAQEPEIREVLELVRSASVLLLGIGVAQAMARRRHLRPDQLALLNELGAVGETFGYYFNRRGEIVYVTPSTGLKLENIKRIGHVIAVAGGASKAEAILAVLSYNFPPLTLVTDEGALTGMLKLLEGR
ncbi:MAG: central glycolytic s regulator [Bacillota bacterium]|nr:central glycolytic s regulator [Bacillota bacterium]MDK2883050.1 central glycolytic s regulator [Bacillota bacterium]MDK2960175.1 central glycolytic s regulator [Bacillota bacterium]